MNDKKTMKNKCCFVIVLLMLYGCTQQQDSSIQDSQQLTIPISETVFSQADAENVFQMIVKNHCKMDSYSCTVEKVVLQSDTIYGTYTYSNENINYRVSATLEDVRVSKNEASIVTIGKKLFLTSVIE